MAINKMYTLPKGTEPTDNIVNGLLTGTQRMNNLENYDKLYDYYMSEPITSRVAPHALISITNHARYIVKTNVGYLLGNPVEYLVNDKYDISHILNQYYHQTIGNLDVELANDASIFGHAFERVYTNEDSEPWSTRIDPRNVILVYDDTVKHEKMFAIVYVQSYNEKGEAIKDQYEATILTRTAIMERTLKNGKLIHNATDPEDRTHTYGEVPVIEYLNGSDRVGDFEPVISLIDAYNILQSDRVIDRERLVDAILAFYGGTFTKEQQETLKDSRILANLPEDAKVEYIVKNINESDADVLRKTIASDIHKISMTPDMSDEQFAGNSSGVALLYKLLAFENHIKEKERYFENALVDRFRLYNVLANTKNNTPIIQPEEIDVQFKRALPQNELEISQMINNLTGIVDRETLVSRLPFVQDAKATVEAVKKEETESLNLGNYGTDNPEE